LIETLNVSVGIGKTELLLKVRSIRVLVAGKNEQQDLKIEPRGGFAIQPCSESEGGG
jgi:hypothetical protein